MKPKRICLIGPTYPYRGGIAHYTTLLARHLRDKTEHELLFISFSRQYPQWLYKGRSDRDPSVSPLQTDAEYLLAPLNPISWRRTWRRIGDWHPDVVVLQWWVPFWAPVWTVLGRAIKALPGRPALAFICHNVLPHELSAVGRRIWPWIIRCTLSPADGFVVHSQSEARQLAQILPDADIKVNPLPSYAALGADSTGELPDMIAQDRPILLFAGFVRRYKGLDILLKALPDVLAQQPVHLLVVGEFWEDREGYDTLIDESGIQHAVTIIDSYVSDDRLAWFVKHAYVVVLPYRHATQSAVIQLAFGHGTPVITTNVGGLPEVVEHEQTGLVVAPEDPAALAAAVNRFLKQDMRARFVRNIGERQNQFSWQHLVGALLSLTRSP